MSKGAQIVIGATAIAVLVGGYSYTRLGELGALQYYETLDEFHAAGMPTQRARVHGYVASGSIRRDAGAREVRFQVQGRPPHAGDDPGAPLAVLFPSLEVPDLFKDGAEVVVEGRMDTVEHVFVAEQVLAKCPSKFQAQPDPEAARAASL
jgi:cytochrome c-type biogenesis protein CcmE